MQRRSVLPPVSVIVAASLAVIPDAIEAKEEPLIAGEVESASAMELADRLLPPSTRAEVISGEKHKKFVAGPHYRIGYDTAPFTSYTLPKGFCARYRIAVDIAPARTEKLEQFIGVAERERALQIEHIKRETMLALPIEGEATQEICMTASGYVIASGFGEDGTVAGYRQLVSAIRAARAGATLPFKLSCRKDRLDVGGQDRCADKVSELAQLPMEHLYDISRNDDPDEQAEELDGFEAAFGPSGDDGLSWRVYWRTGSDGQIEEIRLRKVMVAYH